MKGRKNNYIFIIISLTILCICTGCSSHRRTVKRGKSHNTHIKSDLTELKEIDKNLKGDEKLIIEEAMEWLGTPYSYGRQDKGVATDCSGFVMKVFEAALQYKLPRNSAKQSEFCDNVNSAKIRPGDLVFFITNNGDKINHVGIMIDEVQFIHASTNGVKISSLEQNFYKTHFQKFGRVPGLRH